MADKEARAAEARAAEALWVAVVAYMEEEWLEGLAGLVDREASWGGWAGVKVVEERVVVAMEVVLKAAAAMQVDLAERWVDERAASSCRQDKNSA